MALGMNFHTSSTDFSHLLIRFITSFGKICYSFHRVMYCGVSACQFFAGMCFVRDCLLKLSRSICHKIHRSVILVY